MTDVDDLNPDIYGDWLANSVYGYGFGYSETDALATMAKHIHPDEPVEVDLIHHVGDATVSMRGAELERPIEGKRIRVDPKAIDQLRSLALELEQVADKAIEQAEVVDDDLLDDES